MVEILSVGMPYWFYSNYVISLKLSVGKFSHNGDLLFYRDHDQAPPTMTKVPQACLPLPVNTASSRSLNIRIMTWRNPKGCRRFEEKACGSGTHSGLELSWSTWVPSEHSFLTQEFRTGNLAFTCNAWRSALNLREPIFKKLVIEFIASYEFDEDAAREDRVSTPIKYRLGGQW